MGDYGYLHLGRVLKQDDATGGYMLESVGLASTSKWGPTPSCVPGLAKGDRVILGATGASRDNLVVIAKVGADFVGIDDIDGLVTALFNKADRAQFETLAEFVDDLSGAIGAGGVRLDNLESAMTLVQGVNTSQESEITALTTRVTAVEDPLIHGASFQIDGSWENVGLPQAQVDRMPWAASPLWGGGVTVGRDGKHLIADKSGIWSLSVNVRWLNAIRYPSGTPGQGTDRTFVVGVTSGSVSIPNGRFELGALNWAPAGATWSTSATQVHSGTLAARIVPSGSAVQAYIQSDYMAVTPGETVVATAWMWTTNLVASPAVQLAVNWFDASHAYLSTSLVTGAIAAATWTPFCGSFVAPAGAAFATVVPGLGGTPAAGQVFYVDDVTLTPSMTSTFWFLESWAAVNIGNQEYSTRNMALDVQLSAGDKLALFCYWGGAITDRLIFPSGANRISLTYKGHV
jgi:hypothetical protein